MTKGYRKIFLSIALFLAVICFGMALNFGVVQPAKADGTVAVKSIRQTYMQSYNSDSGLGNSKYNYSSFYVIEFDTTETLFTGSVGADITSTLSDFMSNTYWGMNAPKNLSTWNTYYGGSGVKIFKYSNTAIELYIYRPTYYTEFAFKAGATVGDKSIVASTWYEKKDLTFTTTAPENLEIMAVYEQELAGDNSASHRTVNIAYNVKGSVNYSTFQYLKINGEYVYTDNIVDGDHVNTDFVKYYGAAGMDYGNDGDAPGGCYCRIYVNENAINENSTITFPVGFTIGGKSLVKEQTFVLGNQAGGRNNINDQAVWGEQERIAEIKSVTQTSANGLSILSTYNVEFKNVGTDNSVSDIFADYEVGAEVPTTLLAKLIMNGNKFATDGSTLTVTKHSANVLTLKISRCIGYAAIQILGGVKIGSWTVVDDGPVWYEQQDWSFNNIAPSETKVFALIAYATNSSSIVNFRIIFNTAIGNNTAEGHEKYGDSNLILTGMTVNGVQMTNGTTDWCSVAGEKIYGGTQFNVQAPLTTMNKGEDCVTVVTFPAGFGNTKKISTKQEFVASHNDYGAWNNMPKFTELTAKDVTYKQGETTIGSAKDTSIILPEPATLNGYDATKTFIGWTDGENLYKAGETIYGLTSEKTYSVVELSFAMDGAEIKTYESAGIRFLSIYNTAEFDVIKDYVTEVGTVIARENTFTGDLTVDVEDIMKIVATDGIRENGENTEIRAGIDNIKTNGTLITTGLYARAYLKVTYASGVDYVYTEALDEAKVARTIANTYVTENPDELLDDDLNVIKALYGIEQ